MPKRYYLSHTFKPVYLFSCTPLQEELRHKIELRGLLQNLKTLNTKSYTLAAEAKARSE